MDNKTNPYAAHLGNQDAFAVIASTSSKLEEFSKILGAEGAEISPAPGKWSAREIICHLADCDLVFGYRLRQALAEDFHVIQPFDQDAWAREYSAYDLPNALTAFAAVRKWNIAFIRALGSETMRKRLTHPERGEMTIQTIVETMAGHDINHLKQLEAFAARR